MKTLQASPSYFDSVRVHLSALNLNSDDAHRLLSLLQEQNESPVRDSNAAGYISIVAGALFFLKFYGIDIDLIIFDIDVLEIPNGLFILPFVALIAVSAAASRAADSNFYQKLISVVSHGVFGESGDVISRSYYGGGAFLHNSIDIWKSLPGFQVRFWYICVMTSFGVFIFLATLLPFAAGITYLLAVAPTGSETARLAQQIVMIISLVCAVSAAGFALVTQDMDHLPDESSDDQDTVEANGTD